MSRYLVFSPVLALLLGACAHAQTMTQSVDELVRAMGEGRHPLVVLSDSRAERSVEPPVMCAGAPDVTRGAMGAATKQRLMQKIAMCEAIAKHAEAAHDSAVGKGRIYAQLGLLYADAAEWEQSVATMEHSIALFRSSSVSGDELAVVLSALGNIHVEMGKLHESEKEELEALHLREKAGDRLQLARSWNNLAVLYVGERKFDKSKDYARRAVEEFATDERATAYDRVSARYVLGQALCDAKDCPAAVPLLKAAVEEAKASLSATEFPIGLGEFLLGYAYWKSGDMTAADEYMREGTKQMSEQLGWGHPTYLSALGHYADFLRASRQVEAANDVDRKIRQAQAVVDVHSLQTTRGVFGLADLH